MSTAEIMRDQTGIAGIPPLEPGDHLDQPTFHERYKAMPPDIKAELVGGIVYMPSSAKTPHGRNTKAVAYWLALYEEQTPGVEALDNTTAILAEDSEPQPDVDLRILETHGGQSYEDKNEFLVGAPELVVEVASSSASCDLHSKLRDYERYGVKEYVVVVVRQKAVRWFVHDGTSFIEHAADADGLFRSRVFGGLWLDPAALFDRNLKRLREVAELGMASSEHADMLRKLGEATKKRVNKR